MRVFILHTVDIIVSSELFSAVIWLFGWMSGHVACEKRCCRRPLGMPTQTVITLEKQPSLMTD